MRVEIPKKVWAHEVHALFNKYGYKLLSEPETRTLANGDIYVVQNVFMDVECERGHKTRKSISTLKRDIRCSDCVGSGHNRYSRAEELIATFLRYHNIKFEREYTLPEDYESLKVDFMLLDAETIIEYDGEHHTYKRSDEAMDRFNERKRRDLIRNEFAEDNQYVILRIPDSIKGKGILLYLHEVFFGDIPVHHDAYDYFVKEIYDASTIYGWKSYDEIKANADLWLTRTASDIDLMEGKSKSVCVRDFMVIYGMTKGKYLGSGINK